MNQRNNITLVNQSMDVYIIRHSNSAYNVTATVCTIRYDTVTVVTIYHRAARGDFANTDNCKIKVYLQHCNINNRSHYA